MKILFKSQTYLNDTSDNIIKIGCDIDDDFIDKNDLDNIFSCFLTFLYQNGCKKQDIFDYIKSLSQSSIDEVYDDECNLDDCDSCEYSGNCEKQDFMIDEYLSNRAKEYRNNIKLKEDTNNKTNIQKYEEINNYINDDDYINKFLVTISENKDLLKTVLRSYLNALYNNTIDK